MHDPINTSLFPSPSVLGAGYGSCDFSFRKTIWPVFKN
jgi:hypothetical protein